MTISETKSGVPWQKTLVKELDFEAEPEQSLREAAKLMLQEDSWVHPNGLYFRVINQHGEIETFMSINTYDDDTGEKSSFLRGNKSNYNGFSDPYIDYTEKKAYLVALNEETNDYKSYIMYQEADNSKFGAKYGRIGGTDLIDSKYNYDKEGMHFYPAKMYWVKYEEKIAKGYIDKSEEMSFSFKRDNKDVPIKVNSEIRKELEQFKSIEDEQANDIINIMISHQRKFVKENYNIDGMGGKFSTAYNQKAVDKAQDILNQLNQLMNEGLPVWTLEEEFKELYKELLMTIPRKIKNVKEYINRVSFDEEDQNYALNILSTEQDLLDAFKDVCLTEQKKEKSKTDPQKKEQETQKETVLEHFGLSARTADFKEKFAVLENMDDKAWRKSAYRVSRVLCVNNEKTSDRYDTFVKTARIPKQQRFLFWHGSRTENWWSIFKNGLSLHPDAAINGKMFGKGLYFAPLADKALGYTDYSGSRWVHGSSSKGYLALFEVAMGKSYEPSHALFSRFTGRDLRDGCLSVWAKRDKANLKQDECIVYREDQATIRYIVEVSDDRVQEYKFDVKKLKNLQFSDLQFDKDTLSAKVENVSSLLKGTSGDCKAILRKDGNAFSFTLEGVDLNQAEKELLGEVFMSKIADNQKEFEKVFDKMALKKAIPKRVLNHFESQAKKHSEIDR